MASNTSMELGKLVYGEEEEDMELGISSLGWNSISSPPRIGECFSFLLCMFCMIMCFKGTCQKLIFFMLSAPPKLQAK